MNPGKVVASNEIADDFRLSPAYSAEEPEETAFDFSTQGGFARAVEMCSGVGACRKVDSGTMCPSYMVTRDEEHSTRGRANALRLVMSGALPGGNTFDNPTLHDALDLCLQCKACKTECPSNVDMAKLKAEVLAPTISRAEAVPLGSLLMAYIYRLNPIGSATAGIANWTMRRPAFKWALERLAGIDRRRTLPEFDAANFRRWFRRPACRRFSRAGSKLGSVVLLDDCFTTSNNPRHRSRGGEGPRSLGLSGQARRAGLLRTTGDLEGAPSARQEPWRGPMSPEARRARPTRDADPGGRAELPAHARR